jgi:hypothetical protein
MKMTNNNKFIGLGVSLFSWVDGLNGLSKFSIAETFMNNFKWRLYFPKKVEAEDNIKDGSDA